VQKEVNRPLVLSANRDEHIEFRHPTYDLEKTLEGVKLILLLACASGTGIAGRGEEKRTKRREDAKIKKDCCDSQIIRRRLTRQRAKS
jgi:hypothetical protein